MSEYAGTEIRRLVWSGFYDAPAVREIVLEEIFEPGEIDPDWVEQRIDEEFARKLEVERAWPAVTDCDKLDRAFDELNETGIIALQNAGFTQDEGIEDVTAEYEDLRIKLKLGGAAYNGFTVMVVLNLQRRVIGVVVDSVSDVIQLEAEQLHPAPEFGTHVDTRFISGLGTIDQRIELPEIEWRRRYVE